MITINDLLNKIKWDKREKKEDYVIGYLVSGKIQEARLTDIEVRDDWIVAGNKEIPMHRIKIVKKKGETIWER